MQPCEWQKYTWWWLPRVPKKKHASAIATWIAHSRRYLTKARREQVIVKWNRTKLTLRGNGKVPFLVIRFFFCEARFSSGILSSKAQNLPKAHGIPIPCSKYHWIRCESKETWNGRRTYWSDMNLIWPLLWPLHLSCINQPCCSQMVALSAKWKVHRPSVTSLMMRKGDESVQRGEKQLDFMLG